MKAQVVFVVETYDGEPKSFSQLEQDVRVMICGIHPESERVHVGYRSKVHIVSIKEEA